MGCFQWLEVFNVTPDTPVSLPLRLESILCAICTNREAKTSLVVGCTWLSTSDTTYQPFMDNLPTYIEQIGIRRSTNEVIGLVTSTFAKILVINT